MSGPDGQPLLVLSRVDKGRVGLLLSDQMWLWARGYDGGGPYLDLLRRLAHWLMKEPELEEEALRASANGRDDDGRAPERQRRGARHGPRRARTATKTKLAMTPSRAGPDAAPMRPSTGSASIAPRTAQHVALVSVGPDNPLEMQDVVSTTEKLRPIAEATGGTVRRLGDSSADGADRNARASSACNPAPSYAGGDYIGIKRTGSSELIGVRSTSLASGFFGLALLLGAVLAAWLAEAGRFRRGGPDADANSRAACIQLDLEPVDAAAGRTPISRRAIDRVSRDQRSRLQPRSIPIATRQSADPLAKLSPMKAVSEAAEKALSGKSPAWSAAVQSWSGAP